MERDKEFNVGEKVVIVDKDHPCFGRYYWIQMLGLGCVKIGDHPRTEFWICNDAIRKAKCSICKGMTSIIIFEPLGG